MVWGNLLSRRPESVKRNDNDKAFWGEQVTLGPFEITLPQPPSAFAFVTQARNSVEQMMDNVMDGSIMNGFKANSSNLIQVDSLMEMTETLEEQFETIEAGSGWTHVRSAKGVTVWKKRNEIARARRKGDIAERLFVVKAEGMINAPPKRVFDVFMDNDRIYEYNKLCNGVQDLEIVNEETKIVWSSARSIGPFKPRDFVTLIHTRRKTCGGYLVLNRAIQSTGARPRHGYVRGEILLAGHLIKPVPGQPNKTNFLTVMQVNPGGFAETPLGTKILNRLCANGPLNFIRNLELVALGKSSIKSV